VVFLPPWRAADPQGACRKAHMNRFSLHETALQTELLRKELQDPACGG